MLVIRILLLAVFLLIAPIMLGAPWTTLLPDKNRYRMLACFPIGFFVELAIFQLLEVPIAFLHLPFTLLCWVFTTLVVGASVYGAAYFWNNKPLTIRLPKLNRWETFYLIVFLGLLGLQIYNGFVRDTTVWSYDDAMYVTYAADTIRYDSIQTIYPYTGIVMRFNATRALQGWLYYPAFLSKISSIPVTVMERTILETYDILLAYVVYAYMTSVLFSRKDNGLIFLIILSVLHIYGWYSQYSVTFRLLGPNYQGKAVMAVSVLPVLFTFLIQVLRKPYSRMTGWLLLLFSAAASSLSLFGAVTTAVNTTLVVGLYSLGKRSHHRRLRYIPWGCVLPVMYCGVFFLYKYGQF